MKVNKKVECAVLMLLIVVAVVLVVGVVPMFLGSGNPISPAMDAHLRHVDRQAVLLEEARTQAPKLVGVWQVPQEGVSRAWSGGLMMTLERKDRQERLYISDSHRFYSCFANLVESGPPPTGVYSNIRQVHLVLAEEPQDVEAGLPPNVEKGRTSAIFLAPQEIEVNFGSVYRFDEAGNLGVYDENDNLVSFAGGAKDYPAIDYDDYWRNYLIEIGGAIAEREGRWYR